MEKVKKSLLKGKKVETVINNVKKELITVAKNEGIYENFGQEYIREIKDKFIDYTDYSTKMQGIKRSINLFEDWCMNYTGRN